MSFEGRVDIREIVLLRHISGNGDARNFIGGDLTTSGGGHGLTLVVLSVSRGELGGCRGARAKSRIYRRRELIRRGRLAQELTTPLS